jgi:hypothetical protein
LPRNQAYITAKLHFGLDVAFLTLISNLFFVRTPE